MVRIPHYDIDWYEPAWYALVTFPNGLPFVMHLSGMGSIADDVLGALITEDKAMVSKRYWCETLEAAIDRWGVR